MVKKQNYQPDAMAACLEKFTAYAAPRQLTLVPETYGFYEVRRGKTKKVLGAVRATKEDGTEGWIINWANRQRRFVADGDDNVIVGRKVSATECQKSHKQHRVPAVPTVFDDDDNA